MTKPLLQKEVNVMSSVRKEDGRAAKQIPRITRRRGGNEHDFTPAAASFTVTAYRGPSRAPDLPYRGCFSRGLFCVSFSRRSAATYGHRDRMCLLRQALHRAPENAALLLRSVPPQGLSETAGPSGARGRTGSRPPGLHLRPLRPRHPRHRRKRPPAEILLPSLRAHVLEA